MDAIEKKLLKIGKKNPQYLIKCITNTGLISKTNEVKFISKKNISNKILEEEKSMVNCNYIKHLIKENDNFVFKLIESEYILLKYKLEKYTQLKNKLEKNIKAAKSGTGKITPQIESAYKIISNLKNLASKTLEKYAALPQIFKIPNMMRSGIKNILIESRLRLIQEKRKSLLSIFTDKENGLDNYKGEARNQIKESICKGIYLFAKDSRSFTNKFINIVLTGRAGTGKTRFASVLSNFYNKIGFLMMDNIVEIKNPRSALIGEYVGQTAPKVENMILNSLESVLFLDEAYSLGRSEFQSDFGFEAINALVGLTDEYIGLLVIIVAGYENEMNKYFLEKNEGLNRRFPIRYQLTNYTADDLYEILVIFLQKNSMKLNKDQLQIIKNCIKILYNINESIFKNQAGDMLNLADFIYEDFLKYTPDEFNTDVEGYTKNKIVETFNRFAAQPPRNVVPFNLIDNV